MITFSDILSRDTATIAAPKPMPIGTYLGSVKGVPEYKERGDFLVLEFSLVCLAPQSDVDETALAEFGNVTGKVLTHSFFFSKVDKESSEKGLNEVTKFMHETLGIPKEGRTVQEMITDAPGHQLYFSVKWDLDKNDPTRIYARVKTTAAV
jgi:hypothetical protein